MGYSEGLLAIDNPDATVWSDSSLPALCTSEDNEVHILTADAIRPYPEKYKSFHAFRNLRFDGIEAQSYVDGGGKGLYRPVN